MPKLPPLIAAIAAGLLGMLLNTFRPTLLINIEFLFGGIFPLLIAYRYGGFYALISGAITFASTPLYWSHYAGWLCYGLEATAVGYLIHRRNLRLVNASALYWLCVGGPLAAAYFLFYAYAGFPANYTALAKYVCNGLLVALIAQEIAHRKVLQRWLSGSIDDLARPSLHDLLVNRFTIIAVFPVIAISAVTVTIFDRHVAASTLERLERGAADISVRLDGEMTAQREALNSLVQQWNTTTPSIDDRNAALGGFAQEWPGIIRLNIANRTGAPLAQWSNADATTSPDSQHLIRYSLELAVLADGSSNIAVVDYAVSALRSLTTLNDLTTSWDIIVMNDTAVPILLPPDILPSEVDRVLTDTFLGAVERRFTSFTHDRWRSDKQRHERYHAASHRLNTTHWTVIVEEPLWTSQAIVVQLFIGTFLLIGVATVVVSWLSHRTAIEITAPLQKLVDRTASLARGYTNSPTAYGTKAPAAELNRIAADLETTAHQLSQTNSELGAAVQAREKSHQALESLLNDLEQKVQDRTADLRAALQKAETADHAKGEFIAMMNHELRTPLNVIMGSIELMKLAPEGDLTAAQSESLNRMNESGAHLLSLINEVLDFSQTEADSLSLKLQPTDPRTVLEFLIRLLQPSAERKNIRLQACFEHQVPTIEVDAKRLKQVILNLLSNALKFTPDDGEIIVRTIEISAKNIFRISVRDNGLGIAAEERETVFDPFHQSDRTLSRDFEGAGLGLTLVKRLTELHGGTVALISGVGRGCEFHVDLPLIRDTALASTPPAAADLTPKATPTSPPPPPPQPNSPMADQLVPWTHSPEILVVEDNETNAALLKAYLEYLGGKVWWAKNGREGINQAGTKLPDLILMDVQMPVMDGIEATRLIRADARTQHIPIVMVTALSDPETRRVCARAGASGFLAKPFTLPLFFKTINLLISSPHRGI